MSDFFTKIQNAARELRLSADEKQRMRVALYDAMQKTPHMAPAPVPAPAAPVRSPYVFVSLMHVRVLVPVLVLMVVLLGGGTAYAAQGSLPGSPLYAIKVNVNDAVRLALATSPQAKAQANAAIAQERLQEAQALEAQGKLDATTTTELQQNFDEHAAAALAILASTTPTTTLAVEEAVTITAASAPEQHEASSSAASSSEARHTFAASVRHEAPTTTASVSVVAAGAASSSEAAQGEGLENIPAAIAQQRQMFEEIRQRVEEQVHRRPSITGVHESGPSGGDAATPSLNETGTTTVDYHAATASTSSESGDTHTRSDVRVNLDL